MMIRIAETDYQLRPSFKALLALEERTGLGLVTLARRFADGSFTLKEAAEVLRAGAEGAGEKLPLNFGEQLVTHGLAGLAQPLAQFLHLALSGDADMGKAPATAQALQGSGSTGASS